MAMEQRCRGCDTVREAPIEGPCPACRGYYRTIGRRRREAEEGEEIAEETPVSAQALLERHANDPDLERRATGMSGTDHVFEGGLPRVGSILLVAKEGTGKTSFLWELFLTLAALKVTTLYISSEQSKQGLIGQFRRFGAARIARAGRHLKIAAEKEHDGILSLLSASRARVAAVDSLHLVRGVYDDHDRPMRSGTAGAVELVARDLYELAHDQKILLFAVGHMNNDGTMAGGAHLRHVVDATLGLHRLIEDNLRDPRRVLRFESKTRFGDMGREALFQMSKDGFTDCGPILDDPPPVSPPPRRKGRPRLHLVS